jgi:nicotinate-nucleotide adenylyltransferase
MEVAVFGGTFDPPTKAHEAIIEACLGRADIDEVWLMPSGVRTDKITMQADELRLQMLDVLVEDSFRSNIKLSVSTVELELPRPTNTATTYQTLTPIFPDHNFWFVFGADSYRTMKSWEKGDYLRSRLGMLLVERTGYELPPETERIKHVRVASAGDAVSSTVARQCFFEGRFQDAPVSPGIRNFIMQHGLYRRVTIDG